MIYSTFENNMWWKLVCVKWLFIVVCPSISEKYLENAVKWKKIADICQINIIHGFKSLILRLIL